MAVKTAQYIFNGQAYNLTYNSTSGKWEATVTAPSKSSYNQPDHVLGGTVKATDPLFVEVIYPIHGRGCCCE